MESLLWGLNLLAVLFACRWALREDSADDVQASAKPGAKTRAGTSGKRTPPGS